MYSIFGCFSEEQRFFECWWVCLCALLNFQHCLQRLNKVDMETADNEPLGCWHPKKLSSTNDFLVNLWGALLPGVRQPLPLPLLRRTRKWDSLHYVYCCSSWWAPTWATCLVIRAVLNIIIFHVSVEQEVELWWTNNVILPLPPTITSMWYIQWVA